jgi:uroporphyrinogen decarboxylase
LPQASGRVDPGRYGGRKVNSRERIMIAMEGGEPDRVPCALAFYRVEIEALAGKDGFCADWIDIRFVDFAPSPEERRLGELAMPYSGDTRLGSHAQVETYHRWGYRPHDSHQRNPLAGVRTLDELRAFPFPEPPDRWKGRDLGSQVNAIHAQGWAAGGNLPHLGGELFEAAWRLRGLENFLLDLVERPDWAHFVLDRLAGLARANAVALAGAGVDVLALDDDIGMPRGMMISPATWRVFFKPRMAEIIRAARKETSALKILYHSDGYFEPIIEDLIEIGVDAVNPIQPDHMDAARLRQRFGSRVALWGTVGSHITFSFATPHQIRQEVKDRIERLGRAGLILSPAYDVDEPDIPWENVAAFLQAVREFG